MNVERLTWRAGVVAVAVFGGSGLGAETLYNGIVLPTAWPPRNVRPMDRSPMQAPYLEKRPDIIPIDVGRQLFVDDFLIERTDLIRRFHYPEKYAGNPILRPETPLEVNRPSNSSARCEAGGVWWDPRRRVFRMWYEAGWLKTVGYAESSDGYAWKRVDADIEPGTNRVLPADEGRVDSWVVSPDFTKPDPYANWVMFVREPGGGAVRSKYATSSDGIHWSKLRAGGRCGDRSTLFYNPFRRKWVWSLRSFYGPWAKGGVRSRNYREADDFVAGMQFEFEEMHATKDVVLWLQPDEFDFADPLLHEAPQFYNVDAVAYESVMLGMFEIWKGPENHVIVKAGMPKVIDLQFAYSRDGFHFSRPDRSAAIPSERWASHKWDAGYVQNTPNILVVKDEKLLFYYSAAAGNPARLGIGGFTCDLNGCYDQGASGIAVLRRDGFASMEPSAGKKGGELLTRPLTFSGRFLFVNAALRKGRLRAEVLDAAGKVIPGFEAAASVPLAEDRTKARFVWKERADLGELTGHPVRFRFLIEGDELCCGGLYAFWVSPTVSGASNGYLGGGGPDYGGVCDVAR